MVLLRTEWNLKTETQFDSTNSISFFILQNNDDLGDSMLPPTKILKCFELPYIGTEINGEERISLHHYDQHPTKLQ